MSIYIFIIITIYIYIYIYRKTILYPPNRAIPSIPPPGASPTTRRPKPKRKPMKRKKNALPPRSRTLASPSRAALPLPHALLSAASPSRAALPQRRRSLLVWTTSPLSSPRPHPLPGLPPFLPPLARPQIGGSSGWGRPSLPQPPSSPSPLGATTVGTEPLSAASSLHFLQ